MNNQHKPLDNSQNNYSRDNHIYTAKPKKNFGMIAGIVIMIAAFVLPTIFWGIAIWRDITGAYCSGECATGWYAVITTWLALPTLLLGAAIYGISVAVLGIRKRQ